MVQHWTRPPEKTYSISLNVTQYLKVTELERQRLLYLLMIWPAFFGQLYQTLARNHRQRGRDRDVFYLHPTNTY